MLSSFPKITSLEQLTVSLSVVQTAMATILVGQQNSQTDEANVDTVLNTMDGLYIPTVTPTEIEGVDKTSTDVQGATQTGTPTFNTTTTNANGEKISVTPSLEYPAKLVDPATGQVTNEPSVTVAGEGTYTIDHTTGKVTFVPEPGFTGYSSKVLPYQ